MTRWPGTDPAASNPFYHQPRVHRRLRITTTGPPACAPSAWSRLSLFARKRGLAGHTARTRRVRRALSNVSFVEGDLTDCCAFPSQAASRIPGRRRGTSFPKMPLESPELSPSSRRILSFKSLPPDRLAPQSPRPISECPPRHLVPSHPQSPRSTTAAMPARRAPTLSPLS